MSIASCTDWCLQSNVKHAVLSRLQCRLSHFTTYILEITLYRYSGSGHLGSAVSSYFLLLNLFSCFFLSHIRMTADDIADVALDWCTDDDISYLEEQKHESGDDA